MSSQYPQYPPQPGPYGQPQQPGYPQQPTYPQPAAPPQQQWPPQVAPAPTPYPQQGYGPPQAGPSAYPQGPGPMPPQGGYMAPAVPQQIVDWNRLLQDAKTGSASIAMGEYPFVVQSAEAKMASTGAPMIVAKLLVEGGQYDGTKIDNNFVLTVDNSAALSFFFEHMAALGIGPEFFSQLGAMPADQALVPAAQTMVGRRGIVKVSHREWPKGSGRKRPQVDTIMPAQGGPGPAGPTAPGMAMPPQPQPQGWPQGPPQQPTFAQQTAQGPPTAIQGQFAQPFQPQPQYGQPPQAQAFDGMQQPPQPSGFPPGWEVQNGQWVQTGQAQVEQPQAAEAQPQPPQGAGAPPTPPF